MRGFWRTSEQNAAPMMSHFLPGIPAISLMQAECALPDHPDAKKWRDAVRLYLDEYVLPMTSRNVFRIMPLGLFNGAPSDEVYRPLGGDFTYRYFMPAARGSHGLTSHFESHAAMLAMAGNAFQNKEYTDLAYRQLEWVMGCNPFGACLMTGEGMRNPYPHSRYEGLTVGAIMNGFGGNENDDPDHGHGVRLRLAHHRILAAAQRLVSVDQFHSGKREGIDSVAVRRSGRMVSTSRRFSWRVLVR